MVRDLEERSYGKCAGVDLPFFSDLARLLWMNHSYIDETQDPRHMMNTIVIEQSEQQTVLQKAFHCAYLRAGNNPNIAALKLFAER